MRTGLQSFGCCPWCGAKIRVQKQGKHFTCPVCTCQFHHRWFTWLIGIPATVAIEALIFWLLPINLLTVLVLLIIAWLLVSRLGLYNIIKDGREEITSEEVENFSRTQKGNIWHSALLGIILLASFFFFSWLITTTS